MTEADKSILLNAAQKAARFAAFAFRSLDSIEAKPDTARARQRFDEQFESNDSTKLDCAVTPASVTINLG